MPSLKIRVEKHRKVVTRGDIKKSDHVWKNGDHPSLCDEGKITDKEHNWNIRKLKEVTHMLGYNNILSSPNADIRSIWETVIRND